jgi:hypothetical protein
MCFAANIGCTIWPNAGLHFDMPLNRPPFLGRYGELHQVDVSMLINKKGYSQFDLAQGGDCEGTF